LEPFLVSTGLAALGEVGGSTQLLALFMAAKFRRPVPLLAGILVATLLNHAIAGTIGWSLAHLVSSQALTGPIGVAFVAMAVWTLIPRDTQGSIGEAKERFGVFGTALLAFVLVEIGDKSQLAAVALAARYEQVVAVVAGTTLGMLLAVVPVVVFGERVAKAVPVRLLHAGAAVVFAAMGVLTLMNTSRLV
jgi:putative Ca2+/H+ antiporter (TMEM165/GDT1 family)